jgi:hypothetical protein
MRERWLRLRCIGLQPCFDMNNYLQRGSYGGLSGAIGNGIIQSRLGFAVRITFSSYRMTRNLIAEFLLSRAKTTRFPHVYGGDLSFA